MLGTSSKGEVPIAIPPPFLAFRYIAVFIIFLFFVTRRSSVTYTHAGRMCVRFKHTYKSCIPRINLIKKINMTSKACIFLSSFFT